MAMERILTTTQLHYIYPTRSWWWNRYHFLGVVLVDLPAGQWVLCMLVEAFAVFPIDCSKQKPSGNPSIDIACGTRTSDHRRISGKTKCYQIEPRTGQRKRGNARLVFVSLRTTMSILQAQTACATSSTHR
jgi:hypothetical protein